MEFNDNHIQVVFSFEKPKLNILLYYCENNTIKKVGNMVHAIKINEPYVVYDTAKKYAKEILAKEGITYKSLGLQPM